MTTTPTTTSLIEVPVSRVCPGLFIAQLDRSWEGTPFLIQGFITDAQTLPQLTALCKAVFVDPRRSSDKGLEQISELVAAAKRTGADAAPRVVQKPREQGLLIHSVDQASDAAARQAPMSAPPATRNQPSTFQLPELAAPNVSGAMRGASRAWTRLQAMVHALRNPVDAPAKPLAKHKRPAFVDPNETLTRHPEARPIDRAALQEADSAVKKVQAAIKQLYVEVSFDAGWQLEELEDSLSELVNTVLSDPNAALWMVRMKEYDETVFARSIKAAVLLMTFGRHIGYSHESLLKLGMIGMLMDTGKLKIDKEILDFPGRLDDAQWARAQEHVKLGIEMLEAERRLDPDVRLAILHHHERADGSGYPQALPDEKISTFGRMAGIVDTIAAMTTKRAYAPALSTYDALRDVQRNSAGAFNPALMEQFIQAIGVFPIGSLIELSNGEVAAVTAHNPIRRLEPRVLVMTHPNKSHIGVPFERDLLYRPTDSNGKPIYIARGLPPGAFGVDPRKYYLG